MISAFRLAPMALLFAAGAHAGSTITVTTAANGIDFAATGTGNTTLVRPAWDMTPQTDNGNQPSPSTGVWVPGGGAPTVAQLVSDLATRGDGRISLREAIVIANATQYAGSESGPTTIVFDIAAMGSATIVLDGPDNWWYGPNGLPPVYSRVVIDGGSGVALRRQNDAGNSATPFRLIFVAGHFHNLVDGSAGATAATPGDLTLIHIGLSRGLAKGGDTRWGGGGAGLGGAVFNQGTLTLDASSVSGNRALGGASGRTDSGYAGARSGGGLGGGGIDFSGGGFRYDGRSNDGGGFLSRAPRLEGGQPFANGGSGGSSRYGGHGAAGGFSVASACASVASGGGFLGDASASVRGDGGGYSLRCTAGGGAFGGGGGGYPVVADFGGGAGGVGGGGGQGSDGGFGGGGGSDAFGGFGGGSGLYRDAWGFGGGAAYVSGGGTFAGGGGAGLGGGVFNHGGSLVLRNGAQVGANTAQGGGGFSGGAGFGGGIFNLDGGVSIDSSAIEGNSVSGGANLGGVDGATAGGALYSRYQDEDAGTNDLRAARDLALTPSTAQVILRNNASLAGSLGGVDCFADAGERQSVGGDEARLPYFHFDGAYTIGADAAGIHACRAQDRTGVYFVFAYYDNADGDFAARGWLDANSDFQKNLRAAAAQWAREFPASLKQRFVARVRADRSVARFSANAFYSGNAGSFSAPNGSNAVQIPGALQKIQRGSSTAGVYDMVLEPNPAFVDQYYWLDRTPEDRNDNAIPSGRNDLVSVVLHEMEHGLGFTSWRTGAANSPSYGAYTGQATLFDSLTVLTNPENAGSASVFAGPRAMATYGGHPLPLTLWGAASPNYGSDFDHFATSCTDRDTDLSVDARLRYALMTTCPLPSSGYVSITMPDRAVLEDLGYPLDTIFKTGFAHD